MKSIFYIAGLSILILTACSEGKAESKELALVNKKKLKIKL